MKTDNGLHQYGQKDGSAEFPSVGRAFGTKTHTLTVDQTPSHTHTVRRFSGDANDFLGGSGNPYGIATPYSAGAIDMDVMSAVGGGLPHNNVQPSRAVLWAIRF